MQPFLQREISVKSPGWVHYEEPVHTANLDIFVLHCMGRVVLQYGEGCLCPRKKVVLQNGEGCLFLRGLSCNMGRVVCVLRAFYVLSYKLSCPERVVLQYGEGSLCPEGFLCPAIIWRGLSVSRLSYNWRRLSCSERAVLQYGEGFLSCTVEGVALNMQAVVCETL